MSDYLVASSKKYRGIEECYGILPFPLTKGQDIFLKKFTAGTGHFSLLGAQGSGKTTVMQLLKEYYGDEIIFCASSGVASKQLPNNIGAGTAHRVMGLSRDVSTPQSLKKVPTPCQQLFGTSSLIKIVVVDEAYAMDSDHLYQMLQRVARFNKKTSKRSPRNIRILWVGDCLQRLPICDYERKRVLTERYGHWLSFKSHVWKNAWFQTYVFDDVKRTSDKVFKACQDVIRYGEESRYDGVLKWLNKRVVVNPDLSNLLLAPTRKTVAIANARALEANPNPKYTYEAKPWGKFDLKEAGIEPSVVFCVGQEIIITVNHQDGYYVNGDFGRITKICSKGCGVFVELKETHEEVFVEICEALEEESYVETGVVQKDGSLQDELKKKVVGGCMYLPILGSSGMTIARAQGRTFRVPINIDMEGTWLYKKGDFGTSDLLVAISRATCVENINLISPIKKEHIKVCRESIAYWKEVLAKQKLEEEMLDE